MSTRTPGPAANSSSSKQSPFYAQRDALVNDIAVAMENVLQNINKLNRSLEGVIAVGNEFGAVEALWSQFEGVMAQPQEEEGRKEGEGGEEDEEGDDGEEGEGEEEEQAREGRQGRHGG